MLVEFKGGSLPTKRKKGTTGQQSPICDRDWWFEAETGAFRHGFIRGSNPQATQKYIGRQRQRATDIFRVHGLAMTLGKISTAFSKRELSPTWPTVSLGARKTTDRANAGRHLERGLKFGAKRHVSQSSLMRSKSGKGPNCFLSSIPFNHLENGH